MTDDDAPGSNESHVMLDHVRDNANQKIGASFDGQNFCTVRQPT